MLNWLKKGNRNDDNVPGKNPKPAGLQTMRSDLQKKFSKGVHYNLKIIIRGDRSSGKTCLWHRLQGNKFIEEYVPTPEIQATSIHWNYKATDDIVKVDVWDVVDKGKPKHKSDSLMLSHKDQEDNEDSHKLDASFLDVYKGAHAVIMVFDITKKWTFNYIEHELPKIPAHIPTLILANHRDMGDHRVISFDEVQYLVEAVDRPPGSAGVLFLESSMKTGFGLKYIHKFFNLPFLLLQRESLLKQLETNHLDVESCLEELQYEQDSEEQNYEYSARLIKEKQNQITASPPDDPTPKSNGCPEASVQSGHTSATHTREENTKRTTPPSSLPVTSPSVQEPSKCNNSGLFSPSMMTEASSPKEETPKEPKKRGFMSLFSKGPSKPEPTKKVELATPAIVTPTEPPSASQLPTNIDEFVPDEDDADNFFREAPSVTTSQRYTEAMEESSDDDDDGNPMVAGFQEELDSDDQIAGGGGNASHKAYSYSDSDDEYVTSSKSQKHHSFEPTSSRSVPKSRVSPKPRKEDAKLQHLVIESDDEEYADEKPCVMQDRESLSDDNSYEVPIPKNVSVPEESPHEDLQEIPKPVFEGDEEMDDHNHLNERKTQQSDEHENSDSLSNRHKRSAVTTYVSSGDDDVANQMVSTIVEDFSSDEDASSKPAGEAKESVEEEDHDDVASHRLSLQLQSSDFDFLEQITNSSTTQPSTPDGGQKTSKSSSHKSKSRHHKVGKHEEASKESAHKKHKKKKKTKTKDVDTANADSKSSKRKSNSRAKISEEDKDLEAFLGGGEGYEGL